MFRGFVGVLFCCSAFLFNSLHAQTGEVKGFVYDNANGTRLTTAIVYLLPTDRYAQANGNAYFGFTKLEKGKYTLMATAIGYDTAYFDFDIGANAAVKNDFYLVNQQMDAIEINVKQKKQIIGPPVTDFTGKDIKSMPSVGSEPDVMQYLQTIGGVVFTGDQGGQLYIRGGSPVMNKIMLDGLPIYNPFHSIGLFSVFDVDLISKASVYTGGFGAEYGGRIGAVIDIKTRDGDITKFRGKANASTFASKLLLEGPIKKFSRGNSNSSFAISYRNSYLRQSSRIFYPFIESRKLPYNFGDLFAKFTVNSESGGYFKLYGFNFSDNVRFPGSTSYDWKNTGIGGTFLIVPQYSKTQLDGFFTYSKYAINQTESDNKPRFSEIGGLSFGLNFGYQLKRDFVRWGLDINGFQTDFGFVNPNNRGVAQRESTTELNGYALYQIKRKRFNAELGSRMQYYASLGNSSLEPRLSFSYRPIARLNFFGAAGKYSQNLLSASSDRDVVNLFYGFLSGPDNLPKTFNGKPVTHSMQTARHLAYGVEYRLTKQVEIKAEGFYKLFDQITNINRDKLFENTTINADKPERLRTDYIIENGNAYGGDIGFTYATKHTDIRVNYSLTYANRFDGNISYQPIFDRRHNGNIVASYKIGNVKKQPWEIGLRWSIGSGFPFTQTLGFYEKFNFGKGLDADYVNANGDLGVLYSNLNGGRLPYYHRLDLSVNKSIKFKNRLLAITAGVTNAYNRQNIFYFDRFRYVRENQLPLLPSVGLSYDF